MAAPSGLVGLSYSFGTTIGDVGVTAKILSDSNANHVAAGGGVTYYPFAEEGRQFGADVDLGYMLRNTAVTAGFDFINIRPQVSFGYATTKHKHASTPPPV